MSLRRVAVLLGTVACALSLPPLAEGPRIVDATVVSWAQVDAVLPSDVDVLADGSVAVLDGYAGRLHRLSPAGEALDGVDGPGFLGGVRLALPTRGAGYWVAAPDAGELRRVRMDGTVERVYALPGVVDVLDRGDVLVVGLRTGGLAWLDPESGEATALVAEDVDGDALGTIAAVAAAGDEVLAVDTLGHRVHRLGGDGTPRSWFGHFGLWVGSLSKPKGVAVDGQGVRYVVDSALGAIQAFDAEGGSLGALGGGGAAARLEHPVQVAVDGDDLLVLDAADGAIWRFTVPDASLATARERQSLRHLRHPLVDPESTKKAAGEARLCLQCHDGVVNDDRTVWDPALEHHPVGVVPKGDVPDFFPRDADGAIRCGTCHSPHGLSDLTDVDAVEDVADRAGLVRHVASEDDLFTRLSRHDAELCRGCHADAAHDQVLERLGLDGTSHPVGPALAKALSERESEHVGDIPAGIDGSCLTCHTPHGAARAGLARSTEDGLTCLACHEGAAGDHAHPLGVSDPAPRPSAHLPVQDGVSCTTCHALVRGHGPSLLREPDDGGQLCTACHAVPAGSEHAAVDGGCTACHAPHDATRADGLLARIGPPHDPVGCTACHTGTTLRHHDPAAEGAPDCTTCHAAHDPVPVQKSCTDCHEGPAAAAARGGHGDLGCTACHAPHDDAPVARVSANPASQRCLTCHGPGGSARRIESWTHEAPVFGGDGPRWQALEGIVLAASDGSPAPSGQGGELVCTTCHTVHGPHATDPGDHLRRPEWEEACSACHGADGLVLYRYFHEPGKRGGAR